MVRSYSVASHRCAKETIRRRPAELRLRGGEKTRSESLSPNDSLRVLFVVGAYFSGSVGGVKRPCQRERCRSIIFASAPLDSSDCQKRSRPMLSGR